MLKRWVACLIGSLMVMFVVSLCVFIMVLARSDYFFPFLMRILLTPLVIGTYTALTSRSCTVFQSAFYAGLAVLLGAAILAPFAQALVTPLYKPYLDSEGMAQFVVYNLIAIPTGNGVAFILIKVARCSDSDIK